MANTATETSTTKPRQSNFELLRIVTMLLVMITHAAFLTSGFPDRADFEAKVAANDVAGVIVAAPNFYGIV